jgi:DNA-binding transcriptional LysR family regulator
MHRWEFDKGDQSLTLSVDGPLIVDDVEVVLRAAIDGVGLAFLAEEHGAPHVGSGALVRVLEDWCPAVPRLLPLLAEQAAASRARRSHRNPSPVEPPPRNRDTPDATCAADTPALASLQPRD